MFHCEARALLWIALAVVLTGCAAAPAAVDPLADAEAPHVDAIAAFCSAACEQADVCGAAAAFGARGCEAECREWLGSLPEPAPVTKARVDGCVAAIEAAGCDGAKAAKACEGVR